jgi:hypothetical protein
MFWLWANHIDNAIKNKVVERSGGYCECRMPAHNHINVRCGNRLGLQHYFFSTSDNPGQSYSDVIVLCPVCYRSVLASLPKKF